MRTYVQPHMRTHKEFDKNCNIRRFTPPVTGQFERNPKVRVADNPPRFTLSSRVSARLCCRRSPEAVLCEAVYSRRKAVIGWMLKARRAGM